MSEDYFHSEIISVNSEDVVLLIAEPNWREPIKIDYALKTQIGEGLTGIEYRMPEQSAPLLKMSWSGHYEETDFAAIRNLIPNLQGRRVAVPIWPDFSLAAGWSGRIHDAMINVGFDEGFINVAFTIDGSQPAGTYVYPMVIGRLKTPEEKGLEDNKVIVDWQVIEESPWNTRITFNASDPASFDSFTPNYLSEPTEVLRSYLEEIEYEGREVGIQGDALSLWIQKANYLFEGNEIRDFLAFWLARRANAYSFEADSLFVPGADTGDAPHRFDNSLGEGYARFTSESIEVKFNDLRVAETSLAFMQTISGAANEMSQNFNLIKIWSNYYSTPVYVTDRDSPATYDSQTWTPKRIKVETPKISLRPQDEKIKCEMFKDDFPVLQLFTRGETEAIVYVEIYEAEDDGASVTASLIYKGRLRGKFRGKEFDGEIRAFAGKLSREFPRFGKQRSCNFNCYDAGCQRLRGSAMEAASWNSWGDYKSYDDTENRVVLRDIVPSLSFPAWTTVTYPMRQTAGALVIGQVYKIVWFNTGDDFTNVGAVTNETGEVFTATGTTATNFTNSSTLTISAAGSEGDYYVDSSTGQWYFKDTADNWIWDDFFRGGWLTHGANLDKQVRTILSSKYFPSGYAADGIAQVHFYLDRPLRDADITVGDGINFYPGCDGKIITCEHKFNNRDNFGGFPFAPVYIEQKPYSGASMSK